MSVKVRFRVAATEGGADHKTINLIAVSTQVRTSDCKEPDDCVRCKRKGQQFAPHDEHHAFHKQTPLGQMWMGNVSPEEAAAFTVGKEFNVTFEEAPPATQPPVEKEPPILPPPVA